MSVRIAVKSSFRHIIFRPLRPKNNVTEDGRRNNLKMGDLKGAICPLFCEANLGVWGLPQSTRKSRTRLAPIERKSPPGFGRLWGGGGETPCRWVAREQGSFALGVWGS